MEPGERRLSVANGSLVSADSRLPLESLDNNHDKNNPANAERTNLNGADESVRVVVELLDSNHGA